MQLTLSPSLSTYHIRRRVPRSVGKRRQSATCAQLSASLDEALSAKRINKQHIRALCELQQEQARSQQQAAADALTLQQQKAENQLLRTEAMLRDRSVKLLFAKGLLNVRGVIDWIAEDTSFKYFISSDPGRGKVWEAILADPIHQDLEQCLVRATGNQKQKDKKLHLEISDIYQHASNHVHGRISPTLHNQLSTVVDIVEGPLLPKEAQMMVCICSHFGFPYKYHQIKESWNQPVAIS